MTSSHPKRTWGERLFETGTYRRIAFTPWLYGFTWSAAVRLLLNDDYPPVPFIGGSYMPVVWFSLVLICPPLGLGAWWLIDHSKWSRATLAGLWLRLAADLGMATALFTYHLSVVSHIVAANTESRIFSRYIIASCMCFMLVVIARDVWVIRRTEAVAKTLRLFHD